MQIFPVTTESLDKKLVFSRFGELTGLRQNLYKDYESIDENEEIAKDWIKFSEDVVAHLLFVIDLTRSLYDRIVDELKRAPDKADVADLKRLQSVTGFWLDLSLLSYAYATLGKTKLFKQFSKGSTSGYYRTRFSFDELLQLGFSQQASFTPESLAILLDLLKQDQLRKHLGYFQEVDFSEEELGISRNRASLLAEYDFNQALFVLKNVGSTLAKVSQSWWWKDPIAIHANFSHATFHMEKASERKEEITSDLKQKIISFNQANFESTDLLSDAYLAFHYRTLAKQALIKGDLDFAIQYFQMATDLITKHGQNKALFAPLAWARTTIIEELHVMQFANVAAKASKTYHRIFEKISSEGTELDFIEEVKNVQDEISESLKHGDVPLLSSILLVYDSTFAYLLDRINDKDHFNLDHLTKFIDERFNLLEDRLNQSFQQLTADWMSALASGDEKHQLEHVGKNLEILELAILLLPKNEKFKKEAQIQLHAIDEATEAITIGIKAEEEFGKNPVKELMIRAKTYFLVQDAITYAKKHNLKALSETVEKFLKPLADNALLRGLIAEIQLRTALLQFAFINKVAAIIDSSVIGSRTLKQGLNVPQDISEINEFKKSMQDLLVAVETLIKNKQPIRIKGSAVNWEYFQTLYANISGAISFIDAISEAIRASNFLQAKKFSDAALHWSKAKDSTFKAANEVAKGGSKESGALSEQLFTIATMFGEMEQSARDNIMSTRKIPEEILIGVLQELVMT
ncbi:MAG: hypothetical protein D6732_09845 [Methanobacteriota archaeon]|nr:MAG: hypothetical protein D6732_09845 [Euryarchaeota archaeon]